MSGAYRESAAVMRVPLKEIAWRRRVGKGAGLLIVYLLLGFPVSMTLYLASAPQWMLAAAGAAIGVIGVVATWMFTATKPGGRADWLVWALRAGVLAGAVLMPFGWTRTLPHAVNLVSALLVDGAGLAYAARLFDAAGDRRRGRRARVLIAPLLLSTGLGYWIRAAAGGVFTPLAGVLGLVDLVCMVWAFALLWRLRRVTGVTGHEWFLDNAAASPEEWVSLLVHRDGHAALVSADGQVAHFKSRDEAMAWLADKPFIPAARAVHERLVAAEPPALLRARA